MKIGDVITYKNEHGVVEEIEGSDAYVRVFKAYYSDSTIPKNSHETIRVGLLDYYKGMSFLNYCRYWIIQLLFKTKEDPESVLFSLGTITLTVMVVNFILKIFFTMVGI